MGIAVNQHHLIVFLLVCFGLTACEQTGNTQSQTQYAHMGLSFAMPGNWKVTEDAHEEGFRYIHVETPGDAILTISILEDYEVEFFDEYLSISMDAVIQSMPIGERDRGTLQPVMREINGIQSKGMKNQFVASFLGVDVPHVGEYQMILHAGNTIMFMSQTATEDLHKVEAGFDLIFKTFVMQD